MQPGGNRGERACNNDGLGFFPQEENASSQHAAYKGQEENNCGQRHASSSSKELGERPREDGNRYCANPWRQGSADPSHRGQQKQAGDHDKYVIEAGDKAKMLLVYGRSALEFCNVSSKCARGFFGENSRGYCGGDIFIGVHVR